MKSHIFLSLFPMGWENLGRNCHLTLCYCSTFHLYPVCPTTESEISRFNVVQLQWFAKTETSPSSIIFGMNWNTQHQ